MFFRRNIPQKYSDEREQLQKKILKLRRKLTEMGEKENERKNSFMRYASSWKCGR